MNLADIRKKAINASKPAEEELGISEDANCSSSLDVSGMEMLPEQAIELQEDEGLEFDFPPIDHADEVIPADIQEDLTPSELEMVSSSAQEVDLGVDETGRIDVTSLAAEPVPSGQQDIAPIEVEGEFKVDVPVKQNATVRHPAYDPVSVLLAGRKSAEEGEDAATDETDQVSGDIEEYLCFKVAHEEYALSIMTIKEIIKPRDVTEVPRMPKFVSGVISLRGVIIPIMDMRLRLSLTVKESTGRERVLVLKTSNGLCGVLVDEVIQVVRIANSVIEDPPAILDGVDREFVLGLGRYDNRMLILLNLESILDLNVH